MGTREDALAIMHQIHESAPKTFFNKVDETQKGMGFVLAYLDKAEEDVYPGDIAKALGVSTARIAAMLNKMEKNGFINRFADEQDARRTRVGITMLGRTWTKRTREQILDKIELVIERVGKDDLEEYIRISRKIQEALED